jgi:hypothetical protein
MTRIIEMQRSHLKLSAFADWLRAQPADTQFMEGRACTTCPIAKFSGLEVASYIFGLPRWASEYIDSFDERSTSTLADALAVLDEIEAKYS